MSFLQIPVCHQRSILAFFITFIFGSKKIQEVHNKKEKRKQAELFLTQMGLTEFD